MAARENQGLQIALIIFVTLTVLLGVIAFFSYSYYQDETARALAASNDAKKANEGARVALEESTEMKKIVGLSERDNIDAVKAAYKKDMETYAKGFPETDQQYRKVVEYLATQIREANSKIVDAGKREDKLKQEIKDMQARHTQEIAEYTTGLAATKKDAESERSKFNVDRQKIMTDKAGLAKNLDEVRRKMDAIVENTGKETGRLQKEIEKLLAVNTSLKIKVEEEDISAEQPDGQVTWVNQRQGLVWLDLGTDDGLRREVTFSVMGANANNPVKAEKKASIEVTRLLDRHLAEARIVDDEISNPIMPGDKIFSPAFQAGRALRFALAGTIDLDGDKQDDRELARNLIAAGGGVIDAEVTPEGKRTGTMSIETTYLIVGPVPEGDKVNEELLKEHSKIVKEAEQLPVKRISVEDFLNQTGYKPDSRTVALGAGARAQDFKPTFPDGIQPKSTGNVFNFEPRTPSYQGNRPSP